MEDLTLETLVEVEGVEETESTLLEVTLGSAGGSGASGSDSADSNGAGDRSLVDNDDAGRTICNLRSGIEEREVEVLGHRRGSSQTSDGGQSEGGGTHLGKYT